MAHGMFPGGGVELVNHFYSMCNTRLDDSLKAKAKEIEENPGLKKGTTAIIADAVEERLRMNIEFIDSWHKALALHASPRNAPVALRNIGTLVDNIWYHAGDRSHDFNWYTKRGILAAVYKSSELCMLQDKSEDFQDTWAFLNRRLSDVQNISKCTRDVSTFTKDVNQVAKAGIFTILNIMGMNSKSRF
ncbi:ubiquinone biosynthesis protein COQ9, mitochondrial-like [Procambarus clarkii]